MSATATEGHLRLGSANGGFGPRPSKGSKDRSSSELHLTGRDLRGHERLVAAAFASFQVPKMFFTVGPLGASDRCFAHAE